MIKVLTSWEDLGKAIDKLQKEQRYHADPLKNWDLSLIGEMVEPLPKSACILDAGCSESQCSLLWFLKKKGFSNLSGMDLHISIDDRMQQILPMWKEKKLEPPFRMFKGDVSKTKFPKESFDVIISLSVIEHGVDLKIFMKEMHRLMKPSGILYVSTDYWPEKLHAEKKTAWGLKWTIFSSSEINDIIGTAMEAGLTISDSDIPPAGEPIVKWGGEKYTFLSMVFRKQDKNN